MLRHPLRVVMYGLGAIGTDIARLLLRYPHFELIGAIDQDPAKAERPLNEVLEQAPADARVSREAAALLRATRPDVVIIATTSFLHDVFPQIRDCLAVGARVVSTCEELVYPFATHPLLARELDQEARAAGVPVLGIGVNPGFVMDLLPIVLTAPTTAIRHIFVQRVVDASTRRATLQQRIGAGLEASMFRDWLRQQRGMPHIGLIHSLRMIADTLGWQIDRVTEDTTPLLSDRWLRTPYVTVAPGQVAGIEYSARGYIGSREVIHLDWRTALGMPDTHDAIAIDAAPPIDVLIRGGIHGDQATAALVVRAATAVVDLAPGLRTVLDLPPTCYGFARLGPQWPAP